jgi:acyl carrier protein
MTVPEGVRARVTAVLVQALGADEDAVTPAATLLDDLGAESVGLLDIALRLEREFGIQASLRELFLDPAFQADAGCQQDGRATAEGLAALRARRFFAVLSDPERRQRPGPLTDRFTVALLVRYVTRKLEIQDGFKDQITRGP